MALHEQCVGATDEWKRTRALLDYDPLTGFFRWRVNVANVKSGTITGSKTKKGYLLIRVDKKARSAHRLAWFWMTGKWPEIQVDHRNLKKDDNRWDNLRLATNADNHLNRGKNRNNTSGFKGVSFDKKAAKYAAYLNVKDKKRQFLGYFETPQEAHVAYTAALAKASPDFGRAI